jgi:hypothetical protein
MRFKYGSATVTAKNRKDGAIITDIRFKIGPDSFKLADLNYAGNTDKLLGRLEKKANLIFAKNQKTKKQQGGK